MTVQEFLDNWNGKSIDFDGAFGAQCMDLALQYNQDIVKAPRLIGDAVDVWTTYPQDFYDKVPNTPDNFPQLGDIVIWGTAIGQFGHIAVCQKGDSVSFTSLDQNWNGVSHCEYVTHNYNAVLGWIRPKAQTPTQETLDSLRQARDNNWNLYQGELQKNTALSDQISSLSKDNEGKQQAINGLNAKITDLTALLQKDSSADYDLGVKVLDLEHQQSTLQSELQAIASSLNAKDTTQETILQAITDLQGVNGVKKNGGILEWFQNLFGKK